jgi:enamine deaminase RidA (YjgF/YER057c/UK114 family)
MSNVETLAAQLAEIFGRRLKMVAAFGAGSHTCAVVDTLTVDDLDRCAALSAAWKRAGLDVPLLMVHHELARALDAFPLEFSEIITTRRVVAGTDLFEQLVVAAEDLRRACEVQARGHLVHLREGYIEASADDGAVARLVSASAVPFRALLANVARLDGSSVDELMKKLELSYHTKGFSDALRAAERLVEYVDRWNKK